MTATLPTATMTSFLRRVGAERRRLAPQPVVRVAVHPDALALLERLARALYGRELAAVVGTLVVGDDSCQRAELRCETF